MATIVQLPPIPEKSPLVDERNMIHPDWLRFLRALETIIRSL